MVYTDMDSISENGVATHSPLLNKPSRVRKVSVDYQGNFKDIDLNGNTQMRRRRSSCSENPTQLAHIHSVLVDAITKSRQSASTAARSSGAWENAFLEQIQSLIETVKVTDSLTDCINEEVFANENSPQTTNDRTRRNSCAAVNRSTSYKNAIVGVRRMSVTEREPVTNHSVPRRKVSIAGLENINHVRRNSVTSGVGGRRCSVTSQVSGRRNSVVANPGHSGRRNSVVSGNGRRNSVVTSGRRCSVSHMPGYGTHGQRRLSTSHDMLEGHGHQPQRRRSSVVKPACFNVSKVSNIQRRLHRIYRQRRRKQRGHVDIEDVRSAIRVEKGEKSDDKSTESESDTSMPDKSLDNEEPAQQETETDENSNIENNTVSHCTSDVTEEGSAATDVTEENVCTENNNEQGLIPNPRRKTSIQIRSWEISRQLRSRRREKRKSGKEGDLI